MQPEENSPFQHMAPVEYPPQSSSSSSHQPSTQSGRRNEAAAQLLHGNIDPILANYDSINAPQGQFTGTAGESTSNAAHLGYSANWNTNMPTTRNFQSYNNNSENPREGTEMHATPRQQGNTLRAQEFTRCDPQDAIGESDQESNGEGSGLDETDGGDDMDEDGTERGTGAGDGTTERSRSETGLDQSNVATENRRKRQSLRRGTACVRCRKKKLKCSGERPFCAGCLHSKKPTECVYEERPKKIPKLRRRQTRLQQIEAQIEERSQVLAALETVHMNSGPFVEPSTTMSSTSMPNRTMQQRDSPIPGPSNPLLHADNNPPATMNMLSSDNMTFPTPRIAQPGASASLYAYPEMMDMGQYPASDATQQFYEVSQSGSFLQSAGTSSDANASITRFATPTPQATPDVGNRLQSSLSSFLAETAFSKRKGNSTGNPLDYQVPANIMSKYSQDVMQSVGTTTFLASRGLTITDGQVNVAINSPMEYALIYLVIPYTQHICIPLHPNRFLDSLALPPDSRPHPALLYILFAEAAKVISKALPLPFGAKVIPDFYPQPDVTLFQYAVDLQTAFCDRSQTLFHQALNTIDRPLDLLKASSGICRFLTSVGRSLEAWHSVCFRLAVACGLHKIPRATIRSFRTSIAQEGGASAVLPTKFGILPSQSPMTMQHQPTYGSPWVDQRNTRFDLYAPTSAASHGHPQPKLVVVPAPTDNIELWERIELFWAVKELDWGLSTKLGWTTAINDEEIQTPWPRPMSDYENGLLEDVPDGSVQNLLHPSENPISLRPQTPRMLALKSLCLMCTAARLCDVVPPPEPVHSQPRENLPPGYVRMPPATTQQALDAFKRALDVFKSRDMPIANSVPSDWAHDQWWICSRANLAAAEVYFFNEYSVYKPMMYERAVASARRVVDLVKSLNDLDRSNLHIWVTMNITVIANTLHREARRLGQSDQPDIKHAAMLAEQDVQYLQRTLNVDIGRWQDIAKMEAVAHRRVKDGLPERPGMYERMS